MERKFKYVFDNKNGILFKYYFGDIKIEDIESSWDLAINTGLIPKETKGFILDYQNAAFDIKISEYHKISDYYRNHIEVFGGVKIAIITQSPRDVVIPTLVESHDNGYLSRPFSTLEAAIRWVLM